MLCPFTYIFSCLRDLISAKISIRSLSDFQRVLNSRAAPVKKLLWKFIRHIVSYINWELAADRGGVWKATPCHDLAAQKKSTDFFFSLHSFNPSLAAAAFLSELQQKFSRAAFSVPSVYYAPEGGFIVVGQIQPMVKLILGARSFSKWPQNDKPFW